MAVYTKNQYNKIIVRCIYDNMEHIYRYIGNMYHIHTYMGLLYSFLDTRTTDKALLVEKESSTRITLAVYVQQHAIDPPNHLIGHLIFLFALLDDGHDLLISLGLCGCS